MVTKGLKIKEKVLWIDVFSSEAGAELCPHAGWSGSVAILSCGCHRGFLLTSSTPNLIACK